MSSKVMRKNDKGKYNVHVKCFGKDICDFVN